MIDKIVIGICDDEPKSTEITKEYCEKVKTELGIECTYLTFMSGEEVLKSEEVIDILLLDIEMNGMNGIEAMKQLEDMDNIKHILFVSGYSEYVYDSFGSKTKGFICKPIEYNRFKKGIEKVIISIRKGSKNRLVEVYVNDRQMLIDVDSIVYVQGEGRYARIVTVEESYFVSENLKVWEEKLRDYNIKRVHKSYLVNYKYISSIKNMDIVLKNNESISIGRKYYEAVRMEYREHLFEGMRLNGK